MNKTRMLQRAAATVVTLMSVSSCAALGGLGGDVDGLACPELRGGALGASFTSDVKANATLRAFVQASGDLSNLSAKAESEVSSACEKMGRDLGLTEAQMGEGTAAKCNALNARIDAILGAGASVKATFTSPQCTASAEAHAECSGQCSGSVDPGAIIARCEPAQLSGTCEGICGGSCEGTCKGDCSGECATRDAAGRCAGQCKGTCHGQCSGSCHASCQGTWKAPRCEGNLTGPTANAKCNASCKAHAELTAECTQPKLNIVASANTGDMAKLVATLEANLPTLIRAEFAYGKRIAHDVQALVQVGADLPGAIGQAGSHALACVAASASAVAHAQASISVSVQASASVSGKAGAHSG
jgi:hypothetical protein